MPVSTEVSKGLGTNFAGSDSYPVDSAAHAVRNGLFQRQAFRRRPVLLDDSQDKGNGLDGGQRVPPPRPASAPVHQYWSATVYDGTTHALLRNTQWSSRASTSAGLTVNADGSVDISFFRSDGTGRCINELGSNQGLQHFRGYLPVLRARSTALRQDVEASRYREVSLVDPSGTTAAGGSTAAAPVPDLRRAVPGRARCVRPCGPCHRSSTGHGPAHQPTDLLPGAVRTGSAENSPCNSHPHRIAFTVEHLDGIVEQYCRRLSSCPGHADQGSAAAPAHRPTAST